MEEHRSTIGGTLLSAALLAWISDAVMVGTAAQNGQHFTSPISLALIATGGACLIASLVAFRLVPRFPLRSAGRGSAEERKDPEQRDVVRMQSAEPPRRSDALGRGSVRPIEKPPRRSDFVSTSINDEFERLLAVQRNKTRLQASALVQSSLGQTIQFEGDVYGVTGRDSLASVGFEFPEYTVFAFFDVEDQSPLMALSRGDRVVIRGELESIEPDNFVLYHCKLLGVSPFDAREATMPAPVPDESEAATILRAKRDQAVLSAYRDILRKGRGLLEEFRVTQRGGLAATAEMRENAESWFRRTVDWGSSSGLSLQQQARMGFAGAPFDSTADAAYVGLLMRYVIALEAAGNELGLKE